MCYVFFILLNLKFEVFFRSFLPKMAMKNDASNNK